MIQGVKFEIIVSSDISEATQKRGLSNVIDFKNIKRAERIKVLNKLKNKLLEVKKGRQLDFNPHELTNIILCMDGLTTGLSLMKGLPDKVRKMLSYRLREVEAQLLHNMIKNYSKNAVNGKYVKEVIKKCKIPESLQKKYNI